MTTEQSIDIDRPIADVFSYTTDHVPEWSIIVVSDEVIEAKPGVVGTRFRTVTEERGTKMEFDGIVREHQPPNRHVVDMTGKHFDLHVEYRFAEVGGRTRVTQRSVVSAKGWFRVMFVCFGWLMNKANCNAMQKELQNLKRLLEQDSPATTAAAEQSPAT